MSTQSDTGRGTAQSAQCGPHSGDEPVAGAQRAGRAGARESTAETAQSQPDSAEPAKVTASDYAAEVGSWIRTTFTPPDFWSTDRPALEKVWAYATRGEWTTEGGVFRAAGQVYALGVALPIIFVARAVDFVVERPSRLAATAVLLWLLSRVPPLAWLI
ncbi:hypothetical protein [Actinomadura decatromicini]|uniref:Uncharacterized protein n=1 Tax=Actinomadura decatromicini TaxID=2604572 RepID=A0A5D3FAM3_9ACTN|nr:hypothetical protein [Actinomadura decatromicini]TYK45122.1 hypothetical protein FXF68_31050 [Actinomadura decatromicini]